MKEAVMGRRGSSVARTGLRVLVSLYALLLALDPGPGARAQQAPQIEWVRQFGTEVIDVARGVAADASGIYPLPVPPAV